MSKLTTEHFYKDKCVCVCVDLEVQKVHLYEIQIQNI